MGLADGFHPDCMLQPPRLTVSGSVLFRPHLVPLSTSAGASCGCKLFPSTSAALTATRRSPRPQLRIPFAALLQCFLCLASFAGSIKRLRGVARESSRQEVAPSCDSRLPHNAYVSCTVEGEGQGIWTHNRGRADPKGMHTRTHTH